MVFELLGNVVRKLNECEVGAFVMTALEEAGRFRVDTFMHLYPLGPVNEAVLVGMDFEDDFCPNFGLCLSSSRYEIHFVPERRYAGKSSWVRGVSAGGCCLV